MLIREARLEDAGAIARVHVDSWRSTYQAIIPESYLARLSYQKREERWRKMLGDSTEKDGQHFIYVAENNLKQIIAFADGGIEREGDSVYRGELYAIYILEAYRGQGIGRKLVKTIAEKLSQSGLRSMLVWVLEDNPACQFYQALGGQKVKQKQVELDGVKLNEIAYGWRDTKVFIDI
ncbi:MAG: N-acetyltransferase family protein [Xenococcaceae cyanobacterium]